MKLKNIKYDEALVNAQYKIKILGEPELDPAEVSGNAHMTAKEVRDEHRDVLERSMEEYHQNP